MAALASAFVRLRPSADKTEFRKAGEEMGDEAGKGAGENFGEGFTRGSDGRLRDSRGKFVKDSERSGTEAGTKTGKSFGSSFSKAAKGDGKGSVFSKVLQTTAARYTLVGGAAAASLPSVVRFTAALAPAAGALVVLPAALSAGAAASATFKVAISGVSNAVSKGFTGSAKDAKKALDALPPSARKFSASIIGLKPEVDQLRASVSERFFAPFTKGIQPLINQYFPVIRKQMSGVAGELGQLTGQFVKTARSGDVLKTVSDTFTAARLSAANLRGAVAPLVKAFSALVQSTAPDLPGIAANLSRMAQGVAAYVTNAVDTGRVNQLFDNAKKTIKDLAGVLINVGSILGSVFTAASAGSGSLLGNLKALTGQAAAFLRSAQGIAGLSAVFGTLSVLGAALHTSLGAVLPAVAQSLIVIGPAVAGLAGPASQLVVAVAPLLPIFAGVAAVLVKELTPALTVLAGYLAQHAAAVKIAAGAVAAFLAIQKLSAAFLAVQTAGGLIAYIKQMQVVTSVTKIWAGVQAAFNLIMDANPFVLVGLAIAALVAGIIIAYQHSETFRAIVQATWRGIQSVVGAVVSWFTGTVWPALQAVWSGIAAGALWLWHNVIEPTWHGIQAVIGVVVTIVRAYIAGLVGIFHVVGAVVTWLYTNIFAPIFGAISKVVQIWWLATEIVFRLFQIVVTRTVIAAVNYLRAVWAGVFAVLKAAVQGWWIIVQRVFGLFQKYIVGPFIASFNFWKNLIVGVLRAVADAVSGWYNAHIRPIFAAAAAVWRSFASSVSAVWNTVIRPVFSAFVSYIRNTVVNGFKNGVAAIKAAWHGVQDAARVPVAFVVNHVINPFIGGLNKAASIVGIKNRVEPIKGFVKGGQYVGRAAGGKISGAGGISDNRQAVIPGVGAVQLQGGEFVVNRQMTAAALPLLRWLNAGMRGGPRSAARYIGRPMADMPGDGSEGWAFKSGGLIGWAEDVWDAAAHPLDTIKKPFQAALSRVPGAGMIKDFLIGSANRLVNGAVSWVKSLAGGTGGGNVGKAVSFLHRADGSPYVWASAGPGGWDCSGIVSSVYNIMHGRNPYSHTFSTESAGSFFPKPGQNGPMAAAWSHPGQAPAGASVGHMMGRVGNLNFESTGSRGVHLGKTTRSLSDFAQVGHYRGGGLLDHPVKLFDSGGYWPSGTLGANLSGRTEYVDPNRGGGGQPIEFHAHFHAPVGDRRAAADLVYGAYKDLVKDGKIKEAKR